MTSCLASLWQMTSRRRHIGHPWLHSAPDAAWCEASIKHLGPDGVREGLGCVWLIQRKNRHHGNTMSDGSHLNWCLFFFFYYFTPTVLQTIWKWLSWTDCKSWQPWIHIIFVATQRAGKNQSAVSLIVIQPRPLLTTTTSCLAFACHGSAALPVWQIPPSSATMFAITVNLWW